MATKASLKFAFLGKQLRDLPEADQRVLNEYITVPIGYREEGCNALHWNITNWSTLLNNYTHTIPLISTVFYAGGHAWQLKLYPNGFANRGYVEVVLHRIPDLSYSSNMKLSISTYMTATGANDSITAFHCLGRFQLIEGSEQLRMKQFIDHARMTDSASSFSSSVLHNASFKVSFYISVVADSLQTLWNDFYYFDFYKLTGMVGYESSSIQHKSVGPLVQALFHMKPIHKAVARFYKIYSKLPRDPTDGSIVAKYKTRAKFMNELSWQFNRMEKQKMPVNLVHLCEILGSSINTALCMDIGRHLGVLIEIFSTFLPRLSAAFTGDQVVVTTEDVGFRKPGVLSRKKGPARKAKQVKFTYIDLDAEEHRNVDQALCKYTSERSSYMVNSDLFPTQPYVKAITKVHFFQLPLIMVLNVQRFPDRGYPDIGGWKTKTFEFKETIDMEQYLGCYIGDRSAKTLYSLYAIFLCRGRCPHQVYSCILQIGRDNWLYFEDELVFPMSRSQVFDEYNVEQLQSFEPEAQRQRDIWAAKRFSSVCMLMYVRNDLFEKSFS